MEKLKVIFWICLIVALIYFLFRDTSGNSNLSPNYNYSGVNYDEDMTISRDEAIDEYWDDIKEYVDGFETIEACSDSGCYSLDADISSGHIGTLNFSNGGYLSFYADIDENGEAYDSDDEGNSWSFQIDMDSSIIDDAIDEWASDNSYIIE